LCRLRRAFDRWFGDSAELFYERDVERYEVHLKRLPAPLPG
jgi:hypothetical protein